MYGEWGLWKNKGKFSALMCISAHEWRETANFTYSGFVCSSFESAAHRWRTVPAKIFSLEQKYAQYLSSSRAHFRVTFDDLARSMEFNVPHGAIKTMPVYYFLRNNASLISTSSADHCNSSWLSENADEILYDITLWISNSVLEQNGASKCGLRHLLSSLKD